MQDLRLSNRWVVLWAANVQPQSDATFCARPPLGVSRLSTLFGFMTYNGTYLSAVRLHQIAPTSIDLPPACGH
jgi:hypothetical protein